VKAYIHARLGSDERATLEDLKAKTGQTESEIVRRGVGRFKKGPRDLSTNRRHLEGFGQ